MYRAQQYKHDKIDTKRVAASPQVENRNAEWKNKTTFNRKHSAKAKRVCVSYVACAVRQASSYVIGPNYDKV